MEHRHPHFIALKLCGETLWNSKHISVSVYGGLHVTSLNTDLTLDKKQICQVNYIVDINVHFFRKVEKPQSDSYTAPSQSFRNMQTTNSNPFEIVYLLFRFLKRCNTAAFAAGAQKGYDPTINKPYAIE